MIAAQRLQQESARSTERFGVAADCQRVGDRATTGIRAVD
jgi:hypothetical protein